MFKSTESTSNSILPEGGTILIETRESKFEEFKEVSNPHCSPAMQPNVNEPLELGVSVKVGGSIAVDTPSNFDVSSDASNHDRSSELIEKQESDSNVPESNKENLEADRTRSEMESPQESTEGKGSQVQPESEINGEFTAPVDTGVSQPNSSSYDATSHELEENEIISHESEMESHDSSRSPGHLTISGIKEHSHSNEDLSDTRDNDSDSERNDSLTREDSPIPSLSFKLNSSANEDAQNLVGKGRSVLRENKFENEFDDCSVSTENVASKIGELEIGKRSSESEDEFDGKTTETDDGAQREEIMDELPRDTLTNTSESIQISGLPESSSEESKVVRHRDNESISISASKLTDVSDCAKNLSSCSGKEAAETEDDAEKEEGELEEGELDDDNDEEKKDLPDNQAGLTGSLGSASEEEDKHDGKKVSDAEEKKRKKKIEGEEEPKKKKKKRDHFYEDASDDFRKHSDFDAMLAQYRRKAAGEEDEQPPFKEPGYDELGRHKRRLEGRPALLPHSKVEALCVHFLEGTCNKGNECQYSHDMNHSIIMQPHQRKMELCKFYQMGCCAKKQKCSYMHKDFPCKLYHTGMKCVPSDKCQYSHEPLSHITKSILLKHIEMAPKDILGTFPRLNNTAAQQIIAVTELCRNKRPCDIDNIPGIREWRGKGFKYVDRAIRSFDRKTRRAQAESVAEDESAADLNADRPSSPVEGSLSPGHQDLVKPVNHREHRPRSGAETDEGSAEEDRKHSRSRKRHRSDRREDEESSSQGRSESSRHHKHRSDGRSSKHEDRRRHRMLDHYSKRDESRLEEPCGRSAARFDYGGRDDPRMDDGRSGSRRRASRWGDDRDDAGGSLSPGSSPNAHRHVGGRSRAEFLDTGEGYGKHSQRRTERDRHSSRERRAWPSSDDDEGRRNRRYGDPGVPSSPQGDPRESSEDDVSTAAIAATLESIPSMLDSFKRNSSSHQDHDARVSDRMCADSDRGSDRSMDRNYPMDRSSSRMSNSNSDRFNASAGDKNDESRSCSSFQGRYDPLEIFRRQQMQESASSREGPILGPSGDGAVEYSPYLKNFKKVPSAAVSPVRSSSQHYASGTSAASSFEGMSRDRDMTDPRRDSAGSSSKELRRTPPRSEEEERSSSMVLKLNLSNINVPSDLAQVLSSLKNQTRLPKSNSVPTSVASPTSRVSPPRREDFMPIRDSPSVQDSPYLKSFRSWSPSTGNQMSKEPSAFMSDSRQRTSTENDHFENKRSDSMPSNFYEPLESRSNSEPGIADPRRGVKDQALSSFRDPRLARGFSNLDQSSRSARSSSDSDDRSNDPALEVDLKRLQSSSSTGPFMSEIPFEIPHHEPVTVINASITTNPPMVYRLVEVTIPKVNLDSIKSRFDRDHPRVHEDPRLFKMFFNPDASESRSPGSIVYEDPQSPPPAEMSPSQGNLESRDPRINRDPRVAETRNVDPRINTDPRMNNDPRRNVDPRGNSDPRNRNLPGSIAAPDLDVRLSGDESPDSRGGDPRLGSHTDPRLESRRSDPRLNNRDPRANRNFDENIMTNAASMGETYPPGLLGNAPGPMVPFGGSAMGNMSGSSSMGLLNGPPGMAGHMPMAGPMPNMYPQNMMNHLSQPPDMMHKMPHNMGPPDMNPYSSRYGVGPHGPPMMGAGMNDPSVPSPNSLGQGSHLGMNSNILPPHSLQGNWPPTSSFQNADPRLKKN